MDQPAHISPALKELLIADLVPYARNSRTHSAEQIDQIAASIAEFGFTNPVLVDGAGTIIAGHGRVQAAAKHSTQKPVECMRRPMENNSVAGELVYDPFLGSGTTVIAAEDCGRRCFGMEIAPQYVDVICRRWKMYTGNDAVRESDGKLFSELS